MKLLEQAKEAGEKVLGVKSEEVSSRLGLTVGDGAGDVETKGAAEVAITAAATVAAVAVGAVVIAGPTLVIFGLGWWAAKSKYKKKH